MPNHCGNRLTVSGPQHDIDSFFDTFSHTDEDGETYYIYLQKFKKELTQLYFENGGTLQDTKQILWTPYGTKWGCYDFWEPVKTPGHLTLTFKTAWCPFNNMTLQFMSQKFPSLFFWLEFAEQGVGFAGERKARCGKILLQNDFINMYDDVVKYNEETEECKWLKPGYERIHGLWNMSG